MRKLEEEKKKLTFKLERKRAKGRRAEKLSEKEEENMKRIKTKVEG